MKCRVNFLYNKKKLIDIDRHARHLSNVYRVVDFIDTIDNLSKRSNDRLIT